MDLAMRRIFSMLLCNSTHCSGNVVMVNRQLKFYYLCYVAFVLLATDDKCCRHYSGELAPAKVIGAAAQKKRLHEILKINQNSRRCSQQLL